MDKHLIGNAEAVLVMAKALLEKHSDRLRDEEVSVYRRRLGQVQGLLQQDDERRLVEALDRLGEDLARLARPAGVR